MSSTSTSSTPRRRTGAGMGEERWAHYRSVYTGGVARPYDACFGDGTPLTDDDILAIYDALDAVMVSFPWQHGDVLLIDNVHTGHGRNPYVGHRDVQVAAHRLRLATRRPTTPRRSAAQRRACASSCHCRIGG